MEHDLARKLNLYVILQERGQICTAFSFGLLRRKLSVEDFAPFVQSIYHRTRLTSPALTLSYQPHSITAQLDGLRFEDDYSFTERNLKLIERKLKQMNMARFEIAQLPGNEDIVLEALAQFQEVATATSNAWEIWLSYGFQPRPNIDFLSEFIQELEAIIQHSASGHGKQLGDLLTCEMDWRKIRLRVINGLTYSSPALAFCLELKKLRDTYRTIVPL